MPTDISVVIPVRDDVRIERCLRSFDEPRARPLVVLNDATPAVKRIVAESGAACRELPEPGAPAACERGIDDAETDHVLMMDSDCVFLPGTLTAFVASAGSADFVRGVTLFRHHSRSERVVSKVRARHTNSPHMVFKVPLLIDRRVRDRLGGYIFDKRLEWTEDFDLTQRIRSAAASVRIVREAVVVHDALSMKRDVLSAFRYGQGHRAGVELGLPGYSPISARGLLRGMGKALRRYGVAETMYGLATNSALTAGYALGSSRRR